MEPVPDEFRAFSLDDDLEDEETKVYSADEVLSDDKSSDSELNLNRQETKT